MLEKIENAIIECLKSQKRLKQYKVEAFPADFSSYSFTTAKGCLLVRYDGSSYTKPQNLNAITQDETFEFSVITGLRALKKYNDSYPVLQIIKETLTGLNINGKKLYPKKREYIDRFKSDLYWGYLFSITLPVQQIIKEDNIIPLWQNER